MVKFTFQGKEYGQTIGSLELGDFLRNILTFKRFRMPIFSDASLVEVLASEPSLGELYKERVADLLKNPLNCSLNVSGKNVTGNDLLNVYPSLEALTGFIVEASTEQPTLYDHVAVVSSNYSGKYYLKVDGKKMSFEKAVNSKQVINNNAEIDLSVVMRFDDSPLTNDIVIFNLTKKVEEKAKIKGY